MKLRVLLMCFTTSVLFANEIGTVKPYWLNVRSSAMVNDNIVTQIRKGDSYKIVSKKHGWCKLEKGYVDCNFLSIKNEEKSVEPLSIDQFLIPAKEIKPCTKGKNEIKSKKGSCSLGNDNLFDTITTSYNNELLLPVDDNKLIIASMLKMIDEINRLKNELNAIKKEILLLKERK